MTTPTSPHTFLGRLFATIANVATHEVFPFLMNLFHVIQMDVVAKLKGPLEAIIEQEAIDLPAQLARGPEGWLEAFNLLVSKLYTAAVPIVENVSLHDVVTTVQAKLAEAKAALDAATPATPAA